MNETAAASNVATGQLNPNDWNETAAAAGAGAATQSQFISFAIGDDQYGVDIMAVREIKGWSDITRLPKQPEYVSGVLNLRGNIVPIVDLRCRFGQGLTETTPLHIVIIVQVSGRQVGLIGDRVLDIVSVETGTFSRCRAPCKGPIRISCRGSSIAATP
jgi:purine-binding chemotaxis protein CheW